MKGKTKPSSTYQYLYISFIHKSVLFAVFEGGLLSQKRNNCNTENLHKTILFKLYLRDRVYSYKQRGINGNIQSALKQNVSV